MVVDIFTQSSHYKKASYGPASLTYKTFEYKINT